MKQFISVIISTSILFMFTNNLQAQTYKFPDETEQHEGTWLQWPHQYEYGNTFRNRLDATWVAMTAALVNNERVHIIAYDATEQTRITNLLSSASVSLANVDFNLFPTNDVWVRDNGPIFVKDSNGDLLIQDWGFNGWGGKFNSNLCNTIPSNIANSSGALVVNLNSIMTCEGGAYEQDGNGVLLACKSSIISQSPTNSVRNLGMTQLQAEANFTQYLGVSKFIWLDGFTGTSDVTDAHIDGFAKFINDSTLLTMSGADLIDWGISPSDTSILFAATNKNNVVYNKIFVPQSQNNVVTTYGKNLGYKGSYCNYYVANNVVLVPNYSDPNDALANSIIQAQYPSRTVVGIDVRNLYENGGMVHCVTQQQPTGTFASSVINVEKQANVLNVFPNPFQDQTTIQFTLSKAAFIEIEIYNVSGQLISKQVSATLNKGYQAIKIDGSNLPNGIYQYIVKSLSEKIAEGKIVLSK